MELIALQVAGDEFTVKERKTKKHFQQAVKKRL